MTHTIQIPEGVETFTDYWKARGIPANSALHELAEAGFEEIGSQLVHPDGTILPFLRGPKPPPREGRAVPKPTKGGGS
jgi:hypothetical protein